MDEKTKEMIKTGTNWIDRVRWEIGVASRRTGMTKDEYWLKYRDEIVRHNRFP